MKALEVGSGLSGTEPCASNSQYGLGESVQAGNPHVEERNTDFPKMIYLSHLFFYYFLLLKDLYLAQGGKKATSQHYCADNILVILFICLIQSL